jgi:meso-butanediol dehydrogenase / (S,S)-butanediol dehydrogenase / diacetyl reductase
MHGMRTKLLREDESTTRDHQLGKRWADGPIAGPTGPGTETSSARRRLWAGHGTGYDPLGAARGDAHREARRVDVSGRFEGKVALVTGAGSGMGRAVTRRLASEGASVFAVDVIKERLDETLGLADGAVKVHQADLGDPDACVAAVAECVAWFGRLDVLGNIAGIYVAEHTPKMSRESYRRVMAVNLDAYFFLAQAAIPHLLESGGNIVNIASNAGLQGVPYSAAYCMSKGGVVQLTRSLAVEFLKTPLRVNAIAPAGTNTNIAAATTFPDGMDVDLAGHG